MLSRSLFLVPWQWKAGQGVVPIYEHNPGSDWDYKVVQFKTGSGKAVPQLLYLQLPLSRISSSPYKHSNHMVMAGSRREAA